MANYLMFWRATGLEQAIHKNLMPRRRAERRHLACSEHSPAELAAFERSLTKPARPSWKAARPQRH